MSWGLFEMLLSLQQNEGQKSMKRKYSIPLKNLHKCSLISCISAKLVICLTHVSNFAWVTSRAFRLLSAKHCLSFWIAMKSERANKKIYFKSFKIVCLCTSEPWRSDYFPVSCVSGKALLIVAWNWGLLGPAKDSSNGHAWVCTSCYRCSHVLALLQPGHQKTPAALNQNPPSSWW